MAAWIGPQALAQPVEADWSNEPGLAEVYPSSAAAIGALAGRLAEPIRKQRPDHAGPLVFRLGARNAEPGFDEFWPQLGQALADQFPSARYAIESNPNSSFLRAGDGEIRILLEVPQVRRQKVAWMERPAVGATLQASLGAAGLEGKRYSVRFEEKHWADTAPDFINANPKRWIVGRSKELAAGEREAAEQALKSAAEQLAPIIREEMRRQPEAAREIDRRWVQDRLLAELMRGRMVADRFAQSFQRPYGTLWRQAVLVEATPEATERMVRELARQLRTEKQHQRNSLASLAALAFVIFLVYFFANAATKGYFTRRLRMYAVLLLVLGAMLLMALA